MDDYVSATSAIYIVKNPVRDRYVHGDNSATYVVEWFWTPLRMLRFTLIVKFE